MEVSCRATRLLFEAATAEGIAPEELASGLGVDLAHLNDVRRRTGWATLAALLDRLSARLDHDPERLRRIGDRMVRAPSFDFLQGMARLLVSQRTLFEVATRWLSPALFPTFAPTFEPLSDRRVRMRAELPPHYAPSEAFFQIWVGNVRSLPCLLGLPRATVDAAVGPRTADLLVTLPSSPTLFERARRAMRVLRDNGELVDLLEVQRREVEASFAASLGAHDMFREMLDSLPALVAIHRAGTILWANRALVTMLGYSAADELVGSDLLDLVDAGSRDLTSARLGMPIGAPGQATVTATLRARDGRTFACEVAPPQPVQFAGVAARLVVAHDVSERVLLQQQLVVADRLASLGILGAGVAHEINNPLSYALANIELARRRTGRSSGDAQEMLDTALEGLGRVRAIVEDLKTFARPDDGRIEPVDVAAVIDSTLSLAVTAVGRARVVRSYAPVPPAAASAPRVGQIVLNLLLNAVDAMPSPTEDHELRVRTLVDDRQRVVFEIEDTGHGIAPEMQSRIFDPFFTTKPVGRGTGLGLSICHQLVTSLGGEISVRSERGRGSTFRVTLPSMLPTVASASSALPASVAAPRRARLLVIDDEPRLLQALRALLIDHEVVTASSGAEALSIIVGGASFDAVLCDLMMAEISGMELFARLSRTHPALADRMIFMTGGAFTERARAFLARVPDRRLEKPFGAADVSAVLRRVLGPN